MSITWRYATIAELCRPGSPDGLGELGPRERSEWAGLRDPARRRAWLAGRVLARLLLRECAPSALEDPGCVEILSRDGLGRGARPTVWRGADVLSGSLSLSHSNAAVLAAWSSLPGVVVGVDLVPLETDFSRGSRFWFHTSERAWIAAGTADVAATLWAVKEAAYKACHRGEPFTPRHVRVKRRADRYAVHYRGTKPADRPEVHTWIMDGHVAALVVRHTQRGGLGATAGLSSSAEDTVEQANRATPPPARTADIPPNLHGSSEPIPSLDCMTRGRHD